MRNPGCGVSSPQAPAAWMPNNAVQGHSLKQGSAYAIMKSTLGFSETLCCANFLLSFPRDLLIQPLLPSDRNTSPMSQGLLPAGRNRSPAQEELLHRPHSVLRKANRKEPARAAAPAGCLEGPADQQPRGKGGPEGWKSHAHHQTQRPPYSCPCLDEVAQGVCSQGCSHWHCTSLQVFEEKTEDLLLRGSKDISKSPMDGSHFFFFSIRGGRWWRQ